MSATTHDPGAHAAHARLVPEGIAIAGTHEVAPGAILGPDAQGLRIGIEVLKLRSRVAGGDAVLASRPAA